MRRTPNPEARRVPDARRRVRRLAATWGGLVLGSLGLLSALILWHLARRGRLIRENLAPPRVVRWDVIPTNPESPPDPTVPPARRPPAS